MIWLAPPPEVMVSRHISQRDIADLVPEARKESVCALFAVS